MLKCLTQAVSRHPVHAKVDKPVEKPLHCFALPSFVRLSIPHPPAFGHFFSAWQMASPCLLPFQGEQAGVARRRGIGATAICASFLQNAAAVTPLSQPGTSASLLHTFPGVLRAPTCHTPSVPISSRSSPHCSSCVREPTTQTEAAFPISSSASARAASSRSVVCRVSRRKRQRSAWVIPRQ